jgi:Ca2+-binding EF-hand superfamily protein
MNRNSRIALIAIAGLVAIGGVAVAKNGWKQGGPNGPMGFEQMTERYDANKDGKISQEEIDANRGKWLADFDSDKSGSLALAEFQNLWLKANNQRMVRDFQRLDADANGQVTLDEYKAPMAKLIARMDQNKDGSITSDEMAFGHHGHKDRGAKGDGPKDDGPDAQ